MATYKAHNYSQMIMLPISLEDQWMPGTLEWAIHELVEQRVETSIFDAKYANDDTGAPAYPPKILFKIVLLASARGMISSRQIERACRENITFLALACGMAPDHSTIGGFVSSMQADIASIFRDILLVCHEQGLLGGTLFALDGLKLPSNAAKERTALGTRPGSDCGCMPAAIGFGMASIAGIGQRHQTATPVRAANAASRRNGPSGSISPSLWSRPYPASRSR